MKIDWIAVIICLLAVVGLYFIFCKLLGTLAGRRCIMAIRAEDYDDEYDVLCAWHAAHLLSCAARETHSTPVVLTEGTGSMKLHNLLKEEGIAVYRRVND